MMKKRLFVASALLTLGVGVSVPALAYVHKMPATHCVSTSANITVSADRVSSNASTGTLGCPIDDEPLMTHNSILYLNVDGYDASGSTATVAAACVTSYDGTATYYGTPTYSSNGSGGSTTLTNSYTGAFYLAVPLNVLSNSSYASYYGWLDLQLASNYSRVEGVYMSN